MREAVDGFSTMGGFETREPTMRLRFVSGRLQQLHRVKTYEGGELVSAGAEWLDVPDATTAERGEGEA